MIPAFTYSIKSLWSGKTMVRIALDYRLSKEILEGIVLDLGSGGSDQYTKYIPRKVNTQLVGIDQKKGDYIDFEKDLLPYDDNSQKTILLLNVLEHIYNYGHLLKELYRIQAKQGLLIGFVPFLKWYHPDPEDYFRYTHTTLKKILKDAGYTNIKIETLYIGPYTTAFDMVLPTVPKFMRPFFFIPCYLLDFLFRKLRNEGAKRYVLGYYFRCV